MLEKRARIRKEFFPFTTSSGIVVVAASAAETRRFIEKNHATVFGKRSGHYKPPKATAKKIGKLKRAYERIHHEYFLFKKGKTVIGWSFGEMDDFETFFMRNTGVLPDFQERGVYGEFLDRFLRYIRALGYERVSSWHHPDNEAVLKVKLKRGFIITGTENHERWGHELKLVRIFDPAREKFFKKKFL